MANKANEYPNEMLCPLIDSVIKVDDCIENQGCANNEIQELSIPQKYKKKENWKNICVNCKYFEFS